MIALADCDAFYVSCERVFRPDLARRAVGVLTNNDGCVIARSPELKALGVAMGAPVHLMDAHVRRQCVLLSSNYSLYGDMSRRVTSVYRQHTPAVEVYSIDESFLGFQGFDTTTLVPRCRTLRRQVWRDTGIPISVGLSTSRTLAKIANRYAKKTPGCEGVAMLAPDELATRQLLEQLPLTEIWGVAGRTARKLEALGIHTAWDLRMSDPHRLRQLFSVVVERIVWELRGKDCITIDDMAAPRKQIMTSRSFGRATGSRQDLREAVRQHATRGGEKLRAQGSLASALVVFIQTNPFREHQPQHAQSTLLPLPQPTDDSREIVRTALQGLKSLYRPGFEYQKCGVMLTDLSPRSHEQQDLLADQQSDADRERSERLMATLDKLNNEHGAGTVRLGLGRADAAWHMRSANRTPRYTTRWDELPIVRMG